MTKDTTPTSGAADLRTAAQAVVDRWDTPLWKDVPATAEYIGRLRAALAAGQATAAPAQPAAQQGAAYAALPTSSHAGRVYEEGFLIGTCPLYTADKMRAFADATHTLRASHGQAPAQPDPAYSEACNLATALFKKHFAHLPDFASGQAAWSLCDSTAGVISQIDNMVSGLVQPPTTSPQADSVQEDAADPLQGAYAALPESFLEIPDVQDESGINAYYSREVVLECIDAALASRGEAPVPPPECETEAEKRAFAFGWFKALESERMKADNKKKAPL